MKVKDMVLVKGWIFAIKETANGFKYEIAAASDKDGYGINLWVKKEDIIEIAQDKDYVK